MENREALLRTAWVGRIVYLIDFIVILRFIKIEYFQIKRTKWNWSGIFCLMTMISCALLAICRMTGYIPIVCRITLTFAGTLSVTKNAALTFYQIRRLQNTFSAESLNELQYKQYGYNKSTFIILYTSGTLLICLLPIFDILQASIIEIPGIGCMWSLPTKGQQLMNAIFAIWYYIWDWAVLILYVVRVIQIKKAIKSNKKTKAYHTIKAILTKIISLTVCYEVATLTQVVIIMGASADRYKVYGVIFAALEVLMPVFTIYFMMEHNNDKYLKCLDMLDRLCCCRSLQKVRQDDADKNTPNTEIEITNKKNVVYEHNMRRKGDMHHINNDSNMNQNGDDINTVNCVKEMSKSRWMLLCLTIFIVKLLIFVVVFVVIIHHI